MTAKCQVFLKLLRCGLRGQALVPLWIGEDPIAHCPRDCLRTFVGQRLATARCAADGRAGGGGRRRRRGGGRGRYCCRTWQGTPSMTAKCQVFLKLLRCGLRGQALVPLWIGEDPIAHCPRDCLRTFVCHCTRSWRRWRWCLLCWIGTVLVKDRKLRLRISMESFAWTPIDVEQPPPLLVEGAVRVRSSTRCHSASVVAVHILILPPLIGKFEDETTQAVAAAHGAVFHNLIRQHGCGVGLRFLILSLFETVPCVSAILSQEHGLRRSGRPLVEEVPEVRHAVGIQSPDINFLKLGHKLG